MTDPDDKLSSNLSSVVHSVTSSLLVRLRGGDSKAWQRLTYIYSPLVLWWCRLGGVRDDSALDISQEVFAVVARKIGDFRRDAPGDSLSGWMRTITKNKLKAYYREQAKEPRPAGGSDAYVQLQQVPDEGHTPNGQASRETAILARQIVQFVRSEFSETSWQAFERCVMRGQRAADVAADLRISRNQVYLAKSRILRRLREEYGEVFDDSPSEGPELPNTGEQE